MANNLAGGYGLRPIGLTGSAANSTGLTQYEIANNYTTAIYQGGIVIPLAGGTIAISDQAVAPLGVFYGVEYVDSGTKKTTFKNLTINNELKGFSGIIFKKTDIIDGGEFILRVFSADIPDTELPGSIKFPMDKEIVIAKIVVNR